MVLSRPPYISLLIFTFHLSIFTLQSYSGFEDGYFLVAFLFVVHEFTACYFDDILDEAFARFSSSVRSRRYSGVEVSSPACSLPEWSWWKSSWSHIGSEGRSASCGEQHHVASARGKGSGGYKVVSRSRQQVQSLYFQAFAIWKYPFHVACAAFLGASQGLVLQCRDATCLISRRRFSPTGSPCERKYSLKSLISFTVSSNNSLVRQRFIRMVSAPNISGTSVSTLVPPCATRKSENMPSSGLAVMPEKPSEPPHFKPTRNSLKGISSRWSWIDFGIKFAQQLHAFFVFITHFLGHHKLYAIPVIVSQNSQNTSGWLFSHPRPTTSTAPALGCSTMSRRIFFVFSWSSPNWEQP